MGNPHRYTAEFARQHSPTDIEHRVRVNHIVTVCINQHFQIFHISMIPVRRLRQMEYFAPLRLQLRLIRADFIAEHNVMNLVSLRICMEADIRRNLLGSADFQLCSNNKYCCHLFFIGCILSTRLLKT